MLYGFDPLYLGIVLLSMVLGGLTQSYIRNTYDAWSKVGSGLSQSGATVARRMLDQGGAQSCGIGKIAGHLTDNYNPQDNCLHLSEENYAGGSVASVAVACHEAGHAVQTAQGFGPAKMRMALVPAVNFAQSTWALVFFAGVFLRMVGLMHLAIILFAVSVVFQLVTLPVEIDASRRAVRFLEESGSSIDHEGAKKVLTAAALTYVAGALISIANLLYLLARTQRR